MSDRKGKGELKALPFSSSEGGEVDINEYDKIRTTHKIIKDNSHTLAIGSRTLSTEMSCPICLDLLTQTMTAKECLHRFCSECITMALQRGNKECPTCRKKLVSKRSLRPDPNFDLLISKIWPDRSVYERLQHTEVNTLTSQTCTDALMDSIEEGMKAQDQNRRKRVQGSYEFDKPTPAVRRPRLDGEEESFEETEAFTPLPTIPERDTRTVQEILATESAFDCSPVTQIIPVNYDYMMDDDDTYLEELDDYDYEPISSSQQESSQVDMRQEEEDDEPDPEQFEDYDAYEEELQMELEELDAIEAETLDDVDFEDDSVARREDGEEMMDLNTIKEEVEEDDDSESSESTYSSSGCTSTTSEESSSISIVFSEPDANPDHNFGMPASLAALAEGLSDLQEIVMPSTPKIGNGDSIIRPPIHSIPSTDRLTHWLANSPSSPQTPEEDMNDLPERRFQTDDGDVLEAPLIDSDEMEAELLPALAMYDRDCPEEMLIPRYVKTKNDTTMNHLAEFLHQKAMEEVQSNQTDFDADPVPTLPKPQHFYVFSRNGGHHIRKIFLHESMTTAACSMTKGDHLIIFFDTAEIQPQEQRQSVLADVVPAHFLSLPSL